MNISANSKNIYRQYNVILYIFFVFFLPLSFSRFVSHFTFALRSDQFAVNKNPIQIYEFRNDSILNLCNHFKSLSHISFVDVGPWICRTDTFFSQDTCILLNLTYIILNISYSGYSKRRYNTLIFWCHHSQIQCSGILADRLKPFLNISCLYLFLPYRLLPCFLFKIWQIVQIFPVWEETRCLLWAQ